MEEVDLGPRVRYLGYGSVWEFDSATDVGTKYMAAYFDDVDEIVCTCPGFKYREQCKHSNAIKSTMINNPILEED